MGFKHRFRWLHDSIRLRYLRLKQKSRPEKNLLGRDKEIHEYPDTIALEGSFSRFNELPAEIRLIIVRSYFCKLIALPLHDLYSQLLTDFKLTTFSGN